MEYGVDRIGQHAGLLNGRVALATCASGRTSGLQSTIERLREVQPAIAAGTRARRARR